MMVKQFQELNSLKELESLYLKNGWKSVPHFKRKNQLVTNFKGQTFKLLDKVELQLKWNSFERIFRLFKGIVCCSLTLGSAYYFSKKVRVLFSSKISLKLAIAFQPISVQIKPGLFSKEESFLMEICLRFFRNSIHCINEAAVPIREAKQLMSFVLNDETEWVKKKKNEWQANVLKKFQGSPPEYALERKLFSLALKSTILLHRIDPWKAILNQVIAKKAGITKDSHFKRLIGADQGIVLKDENEKIYRLLVFKMKGKGSFNLIYSAYDLERGKLRALRCLKADKMSMSSWLKNWEDEIALHKMFQKEGVPNLLKLHHVFTLDKIVDGKKIPVHRLALYSLFQGDLIDGIYNKHRIKKAPVVKQMFRFVIFLHQLGYIHGDLKCENVLYKYTKGKKIKISVADLGSTVKWKDYMPMVGGTCAYLPFQAFIMEARSEKMTKSIDNWSLGMILFRLKFDEQSISKQFIETIKKISKFFFEHQQKYGNETAFNGDALNSDSDFVKKYLKYFPNTKANVVDVFSALDQLFLKKVKPLYLSLLQGIENHLDDETPYNILVRKLLEFDEEKRWTCEEALNFYNNDVKFP